MVLFNYRRREITGKIVYYGPGLCGKTTNLQHIHDHVDPSDRGNMVSLATDADRTLFFDFMPIDAGYIKGMKIKFQVYTVPGQVHYNETRKMVLRGADAVVFVADSQKSLIDSNIYSYENMLENLKENGLDPDNIPLVIQYNKRDLNDILPVPELEKKINLRRVKSFAAVAVKGEGVMETFREIGRLLLSDIGKKYKVEVTAQRKSEKAPAGRAAQQTAVHQKSKVSPTKAPKSPAKQPQVNTAMEETSQIMLDLPDDELILDIEEKNEPRPVAKHTKTAKGGSPPPQSRDAGPKKKMSVKQIEQQMDLKIIMQRLKKIVEENFDILEKQTRIMREIENIKEELQKFSGNK